MRPFSKQHVHTYIKSSYKLSSTKESKHFLNVAEGISQVLSYIVESVQSSHTCGILGTLYFIMHVVCVLTKDGNSEFCF